MAKKHLTIINQSIERLNLLRSELIELEKQLQSEYKKLSNKAKKSEYGNEFECALDAMDMAIWEGVDYTIEELLNVTGSLEILPMCNRKVAIKDENAMDKIDLYLTVADEIMKKEKKGNRKRLANLSPETSKKEDNQTENGIDWDCVEFQD